MAPKVDICDDVCDACKKSDVQVSSSVQKSYYTPITYIVDTWNNVSSEG